jgi:hypothetical protein
MNTAQSSQQAPFTSEIVASILAVDTGFLRVLRFPPTGNADRVGWGYPLTLEKILKIHRMEIVWTFIGNRMDFDYP